VLRFRLLEVGSPLHRLARTKPGSLRRERQSRPSIHWQASIPDSFDEFLRARSKSTRSNIRYYGNRVRNQFGDRARLETFHDGSDLERLQRDAALVAAKTYQHGLGASFEDNELQQALTALAARRGWLRAYVLYLDEDPVAFWLANAFDGVVYTGYTGYDPAHRDARLGTFVLARLIEDACADPGISHVDFGYGDADYKRQMADTSWLEEDVLVFGPSLKALRSNLGRTAVLGAGEVGRRLLAKGDAVARTKRWWRDRLRSREA
jgi:CelD/BcsL family acetyltransferase involved in cellulose biosynthesis